MKYIQIFSWEHGLYIALLLLVALFMFTQQDKVVKYREPLAKGIVMISILQQLILYGSYLYLGEFTLSESLPLHISRINTLLGIAFLLTRSKTLFGLITYFSVFAWLSFIYPSRIEPITHIRGVSFITNHIITLLLPFFATIAYGYRLNLAQRWYAIRIFTAYFVAVYLINPVLDGNYFYLEEKPLLPHVTDPLYALIAYIVSILLFLIFEQIFRQVTQRLVRPIVPPSVDYPWLHHRKVNI